MTVTRFALVVHCHQPVGNFGWVLEEAYRNAYHPFLEALERHPSIRIVLHYSGTLLDWLGEHHPEFLRKVRALVRRGQVEMLGGGYYEPILTMIPRADALGQLELMQRNLARLGLSGRQGTAGAWLPERVWEPQMASLLSDGGVRCTVVDDCHLEAAGIPEEDRFGYYLTEDRGASLALFPSLKVLRYLVPFKPVQEVMAALARFRSDRPRVAVLADDGEKFGLWPGTHGWVYDEGWLEAFFHGLEENREWLRLMTLSDCLADLPPLGRLYLPSGSYEEMNQWSGGFFRNFLLKYPEADTMHKKMLWVSKRLEGAPSSRRLSEARKHLYMAQSNDAYWHGIFGGLYLRHLRRSVYQHLLQAEEALDALSQGKRRWVAGDALDLDADQEPELLLRSRTITLLLDANRGGQLLELSDKAAGLNLADTLTRRPEAYHEKIRSSRPALSHSAAPSPGHGGGPFSIHERQETAAVPLADSLVYDPYRRASLIDHLFSTEADFQDFARGGSRELGDFVEGSYRGRIQRSGGFVRGILTRQGRIHLEGAEQPVRLRKSVTLPADGRRFTVAHQLLNGSVRPLKFLFGSEMNFGLKDAHLNRIGEAEGIRRFELVDPSARLKVSWTFSRPARLWYFPLETLSDSERGMERTYQGVNLTFLWPLTLAPRGSWTVTGEIEMESLDASG
ncbi:MAG: DUF1926 domain-containing protein [Candidatus Omnitrophica bacterium]|nr:DUF1926 domain-containing protein [Candidatus Omnitrophota bacterium]